MELLDEIGDLAGLDAVAKKKVVAKKTVVAKRKTNVKPLVPAKLAKTMTPAQLAKARAAKIKANVVTAQAKAKKATGACGTFDIGCKIEAAAGKAGKYLLILGGIIAVALIGKSYLEKRAVQSIYQPAQRVYQPEPAQSAYQPQLRQLYSNPDKDMWLSIRSNEMMRDTMKELIKEIKDKGIDYTSYSSASGHRIYLQLKNTPKSFEENLGNWTYYQPITQMKKPPNISDYDITDW